ncbi:MAG: hypothetical protein AAF533_23370 [Acidobacteriota bacterium]
MADWWRSLLEQWDFGSMDGVPRLGRLDITSEDLAPKQVVERLRGFGGQGWACSTSKTPCLVAGADLDAEPLLSAELVRGDESVHLRVEEGGHRLYHFRIEHDVDEHVLFTERHACTPADGDGRKPPWKMLEYEVAWKREEGRWRPWAARFTGVGEEVVKEQDHA